MAKKSSPLKQMTEGKAKFYAPEAETASKNMGVFYNPVMKLNRDIAVLIIKSLISGLKEKNEKNAKIRIADPLAATGIRSIRFLKETDAKKIECICVNDRSEDAVRLIQKNMALNKIKSAKGNIKTATGNKKGKIQVYCSDANKFLDESQGFEYIEIDPFGCPNVFLERAVMRIKYGGIIAVTATDTSALSGTYPSACMRKYWSKPLLNHMMHETGLRILIRKVQLIGSQYGRALVPVFCHSSDHYMRVYFRADKGKQKTDEVLRQHGFLLFCKKCCRIQSSESNEMSCKTCNSKMECTGPLWTGKLWDVSLIKKMFEESTIDQSEGRKLLEAVKDEALIDIPWFFDIHEMCSTLKKSSPPFKDIITAIKNKSRVVSQTHFSGTGIRTNMQAEEVMEIIKGLGKKS